MDDRDKSTSFVGNTTACRSTSSLDDTMAVRVISRVELCFAALLTYISARSLWGMSLPPTNSSFRYEEWSWLVFLICTPLAVSFWICAIALHRKWGWRWRLHILPLVVALAAFGLLWRI